MKSSLSLGLVMIVLGAAACGGPDGKETEKREIALASYLEPCQGVVLGSCMRGRAEGGYEAIYDSIDGFTFAWGYETTVRVEVIEVQDPPADGSSIVYRLLEVVERTPVSEGTEFDLPLFPSVTSRSDLDAVVAGDCASGYVLLGSKPLAFDTTFSCSDFETELDTGVPTSIRLRFGLPEAPLVPVRVGPLS